MESNVQVMELQRPGWRQRATPEPEELPVTVEESSQAVRMSHNSNRIQEIPPKKPVVIPAQAWFHLNIHMSHSQQMDCNGLYMVINSLVGP